MPFTAWYGLLFQARVRDDFVVVKDITGSEVTVKPVRLIDSIGYGFGTDSFDNQAYELVDPADIGAVTDGAIHSPLTDSPDEVYATYDTEFITTPEILIKETGIYADVIDNLDNHYVVLIHRELESPAFRVQAGETFKILKKASTSLI